MESRAGMGFPSLASQLPKRDVRFANCNAPAFAGFAGRRVGRSANGMLVQKEPAFFQLVGVRADQLSSACRLDRMCTRNNHVYPAGH